MLAWTDPAGGAQQFRVRTTAYGDQPGNAQQNVNGTIQVQALTTVTLSCLWEAGMYSVYVDRTP